MRLNGQFEAQSDVCAQLCPVRGAISREWCPGRDYSDPV